MFTVMVESGFTASHALLTGGGGREPRHTHAWRVRVAVSTDTLDEQGLAADFVEIRRLIDDVIGPFEGVKLETLSCFENGNASAERVAMYIYEQAAERVNARLAYVEVMEAEGCWVKYSR